LRWSIGVKLTIAFLALAIIPMSATAYYNLTQGQSAVAKVTTENMMELSRSTAQRIEGLLVENQRTSATLAGEPLAAQFLDASEEERKGLAPQAHRMLQNFADTHPDYDAPGLLDVNGIVVASLEELLLGKDRSFRDYFQASIQGQPYVSSMLVGRATGRPGVFLTNPVVTAEGEIVGIDIVWLKGDTIWSIIDDVVVGKEGFAFLVDQDGVIIAHPNRDLLYHSLGELTPEAVVTISATIRFGTAEGTDAPLIPESLGLDGLAAELAPPPQSPPISGGKSGTYRYHSPLDHRDHVAGYTQLEAYPWTVVVDLPEAQFLAPLQRLGSVAWVSVGVMGAIALLVSILLVRTATRPIRHLTDAAMAVERGQPFEPADIADVTAGRDEIAQLGRTFSSMVLALQQEITERMRAEEEQRVSARQWQTTFDALSDSVCLIDLEGTILRCNEGAAKLLGKPLDEIIGATCWELMHGTSEPIAGCPIVRMQRSRRRETLALPVGNRWLNVTVDPLLDEEGSLIGAVHVIADITEHKQAEEALRESEERYRLLVEHSNEAIVVAQDGMLKFFNPRLIEITGYSQEEIASTSFAEYIHPDDLEMAIEYYLKCLQGEDTPQVYALRIIDKDGNIKWLESNVVLITWWEDRPATLNFISDVTERKQAEEELRKHRDHLEELVAERTAELRESEEKSKAQYKGIPVPTYTWQKVGKDLVLVDYNDAAVEITQGGVVDFVGMKAAEMYRDMPEIRAEIERCFAEKTTIKREMPYQYRSIGESKHLALKYAFVHPDLVLVHTEDITKRVQAEEEIKKRTTELREMVNLMAGREIRMAELKDVIRQLRAQLEEAGMTPVADDPLLAG